MKSIFIRHLTTILKALAILVIVLAGVTDANATHNRAGEITFKQINALTFEITVTTYTKASSVQADRDSLEVCFGDGRCQWVQRSNGPGNNGELLDNDIKKNIYVVLHAYDGVGQYVISMTDPNRNGGILNVNFPYSDQVPFHLQTELTVLNTLFSGPNNSPILTNPPIDEGCVDQPFKHNPGAFDLEGDSLSYELTVPLQSLNTPVSNYQFPNVIGGLSGLDIDPVTGDITWDAPRQAGEYNLAFYINEYRNGVLISRTIRDMQITIETCDNRPPVIEEIEEICVVAGDTVRFTVNASDPDVGQLVTLTATGGPVQTDGTFFQPATFSNPNPNNPVSGEFVWITDCEHVREQFYQVLFKAEDDFFISPNNPQFLTDYMTVRIRVVGPPPTDLQAEVQSGEVSLTWSGDYICEDADNFVGFSVWRREGSTPFPIDTCDPGLSGKGYTKIADDLINKNADGRFFFVDNTVDRGRFYCYRVEGEFAEKTPSGIVFNLAEGLPSDEICVQMSRDIPLMTNVSVVTTDNGNGEIFVQWSRPDANDLDTLQNPGPYEYRLYRSDDLAGTNFQLINTASSPTFWQAVDTTFDDNGLNTGSTGYSYQVEFTSGGNVLGETSVASQIYLNVVGTDRQNILTWDENIPWEHFTYTVYKRDNATGNFDSLTTVTATSYTDSNLVNGIEYCYYIQGEGSYNIPGVIDPIINLSQRACAIPVDTVAPCAPELTVINKCTTPDFTGNDFENYLNWTNPNDFCVSDVIEYRVYYAPTTTAAFNLVTTIEGDDNTNYFHMLDNSIAGCYYVTALDSVGNESTPSNVFCVDNCPEYSLPNVFTPNGDGLNDLFRPFPYLFIARVDMVIVDRWGTVVFQTTDPDLNWDGTNIQGQDLAEGAYFYKCVVFEARVDGEVQSPDVLSGYIQLIRGE